jgi:hypothetical protein
MDSILSQYQQNKEVSSPEDLEKNGKVIQQFLSLRKEMSEELTKLQHYQFTNV